MAQSLKIAFYTDTFLPAVDGVVVSVLNFRKELENRGHEVHIFAGGNSKSREMTRGDKNVHIIPGIKFKKYPQYNIAFFPFYTSLKAMRNNFDINHAHTPFMVGSQGLLMSKLNKTPLVGTFHTMFMDDFAIKEYTFDNKAVQRFLMKYSWTYARMFYNSCDQVIAPSSVIRTMLEDKGVSNIDVVPNSVDLARFNTKVNGSKLRAHLGYKEKDIVVLYAGRVSKEKRLETLIRASRLIEDEKVKFLIVGTGPAFDHYKSMVRRMGLGHKFTFAGFVPNEQMQEYYAASDLFCIPSKFETQCIVAIEAMACGKPVVGADFLALKELIVNGKNGEKFRPNDHYDCARKLRKVIYNIESYNDMSSTARLYSLENTTDRLLDTYKRIIN